MANECLIRLWIISADNWVFIIQFRYIRIVYVLPEYMEIELITAASEVCLHKS